MKKYIYKFEAMSSPCELTLYADKKTLADKAAEAVLLETKRLEKKYNYYKENSIVSLINSRTTQELDAETKSILQRAKQYYKLTDGLFDITIATIKELYRNEKNLEAFKSKKEYLLQFIGCEHFSIKRNKIVFDNKFTKIDLGGFVKEYAVDRAVVVLKKHKITSALVNYSGDIYALGKKPDGSQFTIGIKDPKNRELFATEVSLQDQALTTSASYERNYTIGSKTYSHIITKDDSKKMQNSVSIISSNCVESGVFSTSMMINRDLITSNQVIII